MDNSFIELASRFYFLLKSLPLSISSFAQSGHEVQSSQLLIISTNHARLHSLIAFVNERIPHHHCHPQADTDVKPCLIF